MSQDRTETVAKPASAKADEWDDAGPSSKSLQAQGNAAVQRIAHHESWLEHLERLGNDAMHAVEHAGADALHGAEHLATEALHGAEHLAGELWDKIKEVAAEALNSIEVHLGMKSSATYVVQKGDSLSRIAQHHWGRAGLWPLLWHANHAHIPNPNKIHPGQVLQVPQVPPRGQHTSHGTKHTES